MPVRAVPESVSRTTTHPSIGEAGEAFVKLWTDGSLQDLRRNHINVCDLTPLRGLRRRFAGPDKSNECE